MRFPKQMHRFASSNACIPGSLRRGQHVAFYLGDSCPGECGVENPYGSDLLLLPTKYESVVSCAY